MKKFGLTLLLATVLCNVDAKVVVAKEVEKTETKTEPATEKVGTDIRAKSLAKKSKTKCCKKAPKKCKTKGSCCKTDSTNKKKLSKKIDAVKPAEKDIFSKKTELFNPEKDTRPESLDAKDAQRKSLEPLGHYADQPPMIPEGKSDISKLNRIAQESGPKPLSELQKKMK